VNAYAVFKKKTLCYPAGLIGPAISSSNMVWFY